MTVQSRLLGASLICSAFAAPSTLVIRQAPSEHCTWAFPDEDLIWISTMQTFNNDDCLGAALSTICLYSTSETINEGPGVFDCRASGSFPDTTPFWARMTETNIAYPDMQVLATRDQLCPPTGPGAVFATFRAGDRCVQMAEGGSAPGLTLYAQGGGPLPRIGDSEPDETSDLAKRAGCDGFVESGRQRSRTPSVQVSNIVDCSSRSSPCTITEAEQLTQTLSTSYSVSAGVGFDPGFSVEVQFGEEFTESVTTIAQAAYVVDPGQAGYLSAYCGATQIDGRFIGCTDGPEEQDGTVLAVRRNELVYTVIYTAPPRNGTFEE